MKFKHSIHALSSALLGAMLLVNAACADTLVSVGSDTLEHLMDAWSAEFKKLHPDVSFDLTAAGSSTAPPALVDGSSQFSAGDGRHRNGPSVSRSGRTPTSAGDGRGCRQSAG